MMRVLVTGFEPFGAASLNPSQAIVETLGDIHGIELHRAVLPVVFGEAAPRALALIAEIEPVAVISLGQAEGRSEISIERVAINLADARIPDNAGVRLSDQVIEVDGPDAYFTSLPAREMVEAIRAVGVPANISLSAGTFLCNQVFYSIRHTLQATSVRSGFIHVPLMHEQAGEFPGLFTMALTDMTRAIEAAVGCTALSLTSYSAGTSARQR